MSIITFFAAISTIGAQSCANPNAFNQVQPKPNEPNLPNTFNPNDIKGSTWVGKWKDSTGESILHLAISGDGTTGKWQSKSQIGTLGIKQNDSLFVIAKNARGQIVFQCQLEILTGDTGQVLTNLRTSKESNNYNEIWLQRQEGSTLLSD